MVMFFHFFQSFSNNGSIMLLIKKISIFGQTGVSLFFVLSGFLISRILLRTKKSEKYFSSFYTRRILRIFPLYFLFLVIYYFVIPIVTFTPISVFADQIYYWVYLQNFASTFHWGGDGPGHFWSLAVEEHFYLFWPFIIYCFNVKNIFIFSIFLIGLSIVVRLILLRQGYEVFYFTFGRLDELSFGAILAILEIKGKLIEERVKIYRFIFALLVITVVVIWFVNNSSGNYKIQLIKFTILGGLYFSLIGWLVSSKKSNILNAFFESRPLRFTGKISYGLYVYHPACFALFFYFFSGEHVLVSIICSFFISFLCSYFSYRFFEEKILRFKKYFPSS